MEQQTCPSCQHPITEEDYFCPNCGEKIKDKPISTSIGKQIVVYLASVLLPPFGLPWAFRYLRQPDTKSKTIGYVIIALTILSLIITVWLTIDFVNQTTKQINTDLNGSLNSIYSQ